MKMPLPPTLKSSLSSFLCKGIIKEDLPFGPWVIPRNEIFLLSPLSYATVNLKPVVRGHCLVVPRRVVQRVSELSAEEVSDLFSMVQVVGEVLQRRYSREAQTISIQDGKEAGQTVPHVHVHVLPRSATDFKKNDDVYEALDKTNLSNRTGKGPDCEDRPPRRREEMAEEAADLRDFCNKLLNEE